MTQWVMSAPLHLVCDNCHNGFVREWSNTVKSGGVFCSRQCYNQTRTGKERGPYKPPTEKVCPVCSQTFLVGGRGNADRRARTCSVRCTNASRYRSGHVSNTLSDVDAAYLTAFIDGEGTIGAYVYPSRPTAIAVRLSVANTYRPVLEWLVEATGVGAIATVRKASARHKTGYAWNCNGDAAESLIKQMIPYLKIKHEQARLALEVQAHLRDPSCRGDRTWEYEYAAQFRALNMRGPVDV